MKNPRFGRGWDDTANVGAGEGWGITPQPRPLHKLNLHPGDVVRLDAWQDGSTIGVGMHYTVNHDVSRADHANSGWLCIPSPALKGRRPLFTIVSRAEVAPVPDLIDRKEKQTSNAQPRALHKLNLRPGDVVEVMEWQDGDTINIGKRYTVNYGVTRANHVDGGQVSIPSPLPKGQRPLFTIVSRAPVAPKPEKVPNLIEREGKYPPSERNGFDLWVALFAADALIRDPDNAQLRAEYERLIK